MTFAYIVKTRSNGMVTASPRHGESRPQRTWHTRSKLRKLADATRVADQLDRDDMFRTGPRRYEVAIFHRGKRIYSKG